MGVNIRDAKIEDVPYMCRLLEELFSIEEDFNPDPIKQERGLKMLIFDNSLDVLVAESENQIIGMITMQHLILTA